MANSNNVRSFTTEELLNRFQSLPTFVSIPSDYYFMAVRSNEDESDDKFHDKFYLFKAFEHVAVWKVTTNAGKSGLNRPVNAKGCAVLKSDEVFYHGWKYGTHKKVKAYIQHTRLPVWRDNDRDSIAEEQGVLDIGNFGINIHPSTYLAKNAVEREFIEGWSVGCIVFAKGTDFEEFMKTLKRQEFLTGVVLKEF